jgi:hypothetical protein
MPVTTTLLFFHTLPHPDILMSHMMCSPPPDYPAMPVTTTPLFFHALPHPDMLMSYIVLV